MNEIIDQLLKEIIREKSLENKIVGVVLFGSHAYQNAHIGSDIDIRVICSDCPPKFKKKKVEEIDVDIHYTPLMAIIRAIYQEVDWVIGEMKNAKILYDPSNVISALKTICNIFTFSQESVEEDIRLAKEAYESALDIAKSGDYESAYYCIIYSAEKCIRALLKKKNIFYRGPKYLITQIHEASPSAEKLFKTIVMRDLKKKEFEKLIQSLQSLIINIINEEHNNIS